MLSPAVRYVQPVPSFTGGNETPDRSVPGEGHLSLKKRAGRKRKRRAAKAARPGIPGKETLLDVGDQRSSPLAYARRALELVVQVGRRVADADELAGSRVLHADPTHVVEAGGSGGTIVTGTAEREVDPAALEVGRVPVRGRQQVNALGLEEDVVRGRGAGKLTGRAGGHADAAEQVLVVVVREDLDLVHRVKETSARGAVVGILVGVRPGAKVDIDALVVVAAPHDDPGLEAVGLVGEVAEAVTVAEGLAAVAAEVVRSGDVRVLAASRRGLSETSGSGDGRDELAE